MIVKDIIQWVESGLSSKSRFNPNTGKKKSNHLNQKKNSLTDYIVPYHQHISKIDTTSLILCKIQQKVTSPCNLWNLHNRMWKSQITNTKSTKHDQRNGAFYKIDGSIIEDHVNAENMSKTNICFELRTAGLKSFRTEASIPSWEGRRYNYLTGQSKWILRVNRILGWAHMEDAHSVLIEPYLVMCLSDVMSVLH